MLSIGFYFINFFDMERLNSEAFERTDFSPEGPTPVSGVSEGSAELNEERIGFFERLTKALDAYFSLAEGPQFTVIKQVRVDKIGNALVKHELYPGPAIHNFLLEKKGLSRPDVSQKGGFMRVLADLIPDEYPDADSLIEDIKRFA